jgi:hypothetical protein
VQKWLFLLFVHGELIFSDLDSKMCKTLLCNNYHFQNKMKGIQKVEISNFHPILMQFLENDHLHGLLMGFKYFCYFISKRVKNSEN